MNFQPLRVCLYTSDKKYRKSTTVKTINRNRHRNCNGNYGSHIGFNGSYNGLCLKCVGFFWWDVVWMTGTSEISSNNY